ncbi:hypothetical protein IC582_006295 [Cucumis melo]
MLQMMKLKRSCCNNGRKLNNGAGRHSEHGREKKLQKYFRFKFHGCQLILVLVLIVYLRTPKRSI